MVLDVKGGSCAAVHEKKFITNDEDKWKNQSYREFHARVDLNDDELHME